MLSPPPRNLTREPAPRAVYTTPGTPPTPALRRAGAAAWASLGRNYPQPRRADHRAGDRHLRAALPRPPQAVGPGRPLDPRRPVLRGLPRGRGPAAPRPDQRPHPGHTGGPGRLGTKAPRPAGRRQRLPTPSELRALGPPDRGLCR